nr:hypothetical protein MACL_00002301 [Theileria orientalis]
MFYRLLSSSVQFASCDNRDPKPRNAAQTRNRDRKYAVDVDIGELSLYDLKKMVEDAANTVELLKLLVKLKIENMELREALRKRSNLRHGEVEESEDTSEGSESDISMEIQEIGRPRSTRRVRMPSGDEFVDEPNEDEKPDGEVVSTSVYRVDNCGKEDTIIVEEYKKRKRPESQVSTDDD